jgi:hypothetical protein
MKEVKKDKIRFSLIKAREEKEKRKREGNYGRKR